MLPAVIATDPTALDVQATLSAPSRRHWFGTDDFGRDLFARVVHGIRLSLLVGSSVLAVTALLGAVPGLVAGFVPRADAVVMRVMDALMAFPAILLALSVMAIAGPSTVNVVAALGVAYAPRMARLARASVLAVRSREFVDAARALGNPPLGSWRGTSRRTRRPRSSSRGRSRSATRSWARPRSASSGWVRSLRRRASATSWPTPACSCATRRG